MSHVVVHTLFGCELSHLQVPLANHFSILNSAENLAGLPCIVTVVSTGLDNGCFREGLSEQYKYMWELDKEPIK